jgi:hypothetical protein
MRCPAGSSREAGQIGELYGTSYHASGADKSRLVLEHGDMAWTHTDRPRL